MDTDDRGGWKPTHDDLQELVGLQIATLEMIIEYLNAGNPEGLRRRAEIMLKLARIAAAKSDATYIASAIGWDT